MSALPSEASEGSQLHHVEGNDNSRRDDVAASDFVSRIPQPDLMSASPKSKPDPADPTL